MCCLVLFSVCGSMADDSQPIEEAAQVEPCHPWQADDQNRRPEGICLRVDDPNPQPTEEPVELAAHEACLFFFVIVPESESHAVVQSSPFPNCFLLANPAP
jgi:hypothetical protein